MAKFIRRNWLFCCIVLAAIVWGVRLALDPTGWAAGIWFKHGTSWFSDLYMIQDYLLDPDYYHPTAHPAYDSNYSALPRLIFAAFPDTRPSCLGGVLFTSVSSLLYLAGFAVFAKARKLPLALSVLAAGCANVFISTIERGNSIMMAAAAVCVFLAWYDDEQKWKRVVAALMLAFAGVSKVSPAALGFLYLTNVRDARSWQWREIFICGASALVLFVAPFFLPGYGGFQGMVYWYENAAANSQHYALMGSFGLPRIFGWFSGFCKAIGHPIPFVGMAMSRLPSSLYGVALLAGSFLVVEKRYRMFVLAMAMLLIPGNQHGYCGLYLLPIAFWIAHEGSWWQRVLVLFLYAIVPMNVCGYSFHPFYLNVVLMGGAGLCVLASVLKRRRRA